MSSSLGKSSEIISQKQNTNRKAMGRALAYHLQDPEFNPQHHKKQKKKEERKGKEGNEKEHNAM
jgi:hypothetical protein